MLLKDQVIRKTHSGNIDMVMTLSFVLLSIYYDINKKPFLSNEGKGF